MADQILNNVDLELELDGSYIGSAYSPQVAVADIAGGHRVSVTYEDAEVGVHTTTFDVLDGLSATVAITDVTEGHVVTFTDANGTHSYTVPDWSGAEAARVSAEQARALAEAGRVSAETARASAEAGRADAETARVGAESSRVTAESGRASAESSRASAESSRASAETARAGAESTRASQETARQSAEGSRASAETARASAETARASAESNRASAESTRVSQENTRKSQENARKSAETARANAETSRANAESARVTAESGRVSAESARVTAESGRVTAEDGRVAAELVRQATYQGKADVDGSYPQLVAGAAQALTGSDETLATWMQRTSTQDGVAEVKSIHGNTVIWNQLNNNTSGDYTSASVEFTNNGDGSWTANGTASAKSNKPIQNNTPLVVGHKYLIKGGPVGGTLTFSGISTGTSGGASAIWTNTEMTSGNFRVDFNNGASFDHVKFYPQLFDLTQMFGAGNEPATVAEFEALFPESYYPYSAPTLKSVSITGIKSTGFNLWDEEWEMGQISTENGQNSSTNTRIRPKNYIPINANATYYFKASTSVYLFFYDASKQYIGYHGSSMKSKTFTPSALKNTYGGNSFSNAAYMRFRYDTPTYNHDVCINLSDPSRNGTYEPHWSQERSIPVDTYFPAGLKSAGSAYDELTEDAAIQRIGEATIDLSASGVEFSCDGVTNDAGLYNHIIAFTDGAWSQSAFSGFATTGSESSEIVPSSSVKSSLGAADKPAAFSSATEEGIAIRSGLKKLYYRSKTQYTEQALAALLATGDNSKVYAPLATPVTTPISPALNMSYKTELCGTEEVMLDSTANAPQSAPVPMVTVYGYTADGIVDKSLSVIAPVERGKASANYAVGSYLVMGHTLYKVTTAIASGESITPGTNVVATTVMAEVIALTS